MENISYIGLSQQMALTSMMNAAANNIANMNTPGFKGQQVMFTDYLNKGDDRWARPKDAIHQVLDYASYRDLAQGSLQMTGNDLDVALQGEGYFTVGGPNGNRYTRNGSFSLNAYRELVTKTGERVQGDGGPIVIPQEARHITITPEGMVATEQGEVGQIRIVNFADQQQMLEEGDGFYSAAAGVNPGVAEDARVVQGAIESSNVNPVLEMNRMVEVLRMYQSTYKMLQNDHERIRGAIQKLTRV